MYKLTVIIVNYNVKHFLEQCLHSVQKAAKSINLEIIVLDNNSVDGSVSLVKEKFPTIKLIENNENQGFAKGNNQAIQQAKGEYILLLNPDTVVQEDTFAKCVSFMDEHPEAGALGVKMIDGNGNFLPESKRSLPTPLVAFYRVFGLSKLFPNSKTFGRYHLTYLDKDEIHPVDILPGAFMMIRRAALDKAGLLDETFFMYGEDIDLSYRIKKAGYTNYYFPKTTIIHYKGESTKKRSINYVLIFYKAMVIFAQKHFTQKQMRVFSILIYLAIYFRAFLSIIRRCLSAITLPVIDMAVTYAGYIQIVNGWELLHFEQKEAYPPEYFHFVLPAYILIWTLSIAISGGYQSPPKLKNSIRGIILGTGVILIIYALLPESWRFSRLLIFAGAAWTLLAIAGIRTILHTFHLNGYRQGLNTKKRLVIVADQEEARRIQNIIEQIELKTDIIGFVSPHPENGHKSPYIGNTDQLKEIISVNKIDEIIFSAKELSTQNIIKKMLELSASKVNFKIAPPESLSIIGSNSINTSGDLYVINFNSIIKPANRRNKRFFDIITSIVLLIGSPLFIFFIKHPHKYLLNCIKVLLGQKTWIGFYDHPDLNNGKLPQLKDGVLTPLDGLNQQHVSREMLEEINLLYSKEYRLENDLSILIKGFKQLGRN